MAKKIICQHDQCSKFGLAQPEANYYISNYKLMSRLPICKNCISENLDLTKLSDILGILQVLNYPYFDNTWQLIAKDYPDAVLSRYIAEIRRNVNTKKMGFSDTEKLPEECTGLIQVDLVTDGMKERFGSNFTNDELLAMEKKYRFLQPSFDEITSMHTEFLISYIRYRVKEEFATSDNDVASAKQWGALAEKAASQAGFTPAQMRKADLIGGITAFGELTQVIEENCGGVIEIMPQFLQRPRDVPDFTIWNYIDCARHLEGKDQVSYADVYKFYDKRKQDFEDENKDMANIFDGDKPDEYRPKVEKFMRMPKDPSESKIGEMDG